MSATCFDVVPKGKLHIGSKCESEIRNFTCINRRARRLIWTHSLIQSCAYPMKEKGGEEEGRKRKRPTLWSLVFYLRECDLS